MENKCECPTKGILQPGMESWYNAEKELPFVNHEPGKCKCTNELKQCMRKGKILWLCSNCVLRPDEEIKK